MKIRKVRLSENAKIEGDLVVVIDVIRAFTTAAFAFHKGAERIFMVAEPCDAFAIQKKIPDAVLIGESQGIPLPGFHFGNSPTEITKNCFKGKTLIQRTSAGTQGVVKSRHIPLILTSSFVVAEATLNRIQALRPSYITLLITGIKNGDEDEALADYLERRLRKAQVNPLIYLNRVRNSPSGRTFSSGRFPQFPKVDLEAACSLDRFSFAMEVFKEHNYLVLQTRPKQPEKSEI